LKFLIKIIYFHINNKNININKIIKKKKY